MALHLQWANNNKKVPICTVSWILCFRLETLYSFQNNKGNHKQRTYPSLQISSKYLLSRCLEPLKTLWGALLGCSITYPLGIWKTRDTSGNYILRFGMVLGLFATTYQSIWSLLPRFDFFSLKQQGNKKISERDLPSFMAHLNERWYVYAVCIYLSIHDLCVFKSMVIWNLSLVGLPANVYFL